MLEMYPEPPAAPVEHAVRAERSAKCSLCELSKGARTVCIPDDGAPGGLMVVGEVPGFEDDQRGRPFVGGAGQLVRTLVRRYWAGPVAYSNALRCFGGSRDAKKTRDKRQVYKMVEACRPYLAQTLDEVGPQRVLALGSAAAYSLLGRAPPVMSVLGGYGWLRTADLGAARRDVPVYLLPSPSAVAGNRFLRAEFEEAFRAAVQDPIPRRRTTGYARVVEDAKDAASAETELSRAPWVVVDVETSGQLHEPGLFKLLAVGMCPEGSDDAWVFAGAALADPACHDVLRRLLRDLRWVGQSGKFDLQALRNAGFDLPSRPVIDTMLARRLLRADALGRLEYQAELVGMGGHKEEAQGDVDEAVGTLRKAYLATQRPEPVGKAPREKREVAVRIMEGASSDPILMAGLRGGWEPEVFGFQLLSPDVLCRYVARDAASEARLAEKHLPALQADHNLSALWDKVVSRATHAFARVETWGVGADRAALERFSAYLDAKQRERLARLAPYGINVRSNQQVADLMFNKLGLPRQGKTDGGADSTDKGTLAALKGTHPFIDDLTEWRRLDKLRGTYADGGERDDPDAPFRLGGGGLLPFIHADGRMHPSFKIAGTETGRLSCEKPNLQNQPRAKSEEGRMVRDVFVAAPGRVLVEFDYAQLEIRVAAALSGDETMREILESGVDFHLQAARLIAWVWKKAPEEITKDGAERDFAKTLVFAVLYGKGDKGVAETLGCSVEMAQRVREALFGKFRQLHGWVMEQRRFVQNNGYVYTTWDGQPARRRNLYDAGWSEDGDNARVAEAMRSAVNSPVQGGGSEYCLASVCECVDWLDDVGVDAKLVLTVHDSIMFEAADYAVDLLLRDVPEIMVGWPVPNGVRLGVDAKVGRSWGSMKAVKLPG